MRDMNIVTDLAPTGTLCVSINLGNPALTQGTAARPSGVTADIARELGARLQIPVEFTCVGAARQSFETMVEGRADICFLAVDPAREEQVAFTAPYAVIEGVFVVPESSPTASADDVDRAGIRIGVKEGSVYDLFLARTLQHAEIVRGAEGTAVFVDQQLEAGAGIRQPVLDLVATHPGLRVLEPTFMEIRQAVGTARSKHQETKDFLYRFVEDLKADGFIADSLARSGRRDAKVAPLAPRPGVA